MGLFDAIGEFIDKRKFNKLYKTIDLSYYNLIRKIFQNTDNIKQQAKLMKEKQNILAELDNILSVYDNVIEHIKIKYEREEEWNILLILYK